MYGSSTNGTIAKSHSPIGRPPKPAPTPIHGKTGGMHAESLPNGQPVEVVAHSTHDAEVASDDEIKYEIATKSVIPDDVLEGDVEDDSSDDDTGSGVDDDEAMGSTSSRGADESARQLFHPPEESDYGDETDDDGTVSSSSSSESSPAADAEPMVALPSANIQHEQDYPKQILEMANSGRPYLAWFGTHHPAAMIEMFYIAAVLTDLLAQMRVFRSKNAVAHSFRMGTRDAPKSRATLGSVQCAPVDKYTKPISVLVTISSSHTRDLCSTTIWTALCQ